jgi:hypothetical protein
MPEGRGSASQVGPTPGGQFRKTRTCSLFANNLLRLVKACIAAVSHIQAMGSNGVSNKSKLNVRTSFSRVKPQTQCTALSSSNAPQNSTVLAGLHPRTTIIFCFLQRRKSGEYSSCQQSLETRKRLGPFESPIVANLTHGKGALWGDRFHLSGYWM